MAGELAEWAVDGPRGRCKRSFVLDIPEDGCAPGPGAEGPLYAVRAADDHVASADVKILIEPTGLATYPDVSVVCGPLMRAVRDSLALTNPILLVEVTSPSTEDYDRGDKLSHYRQIPSLQAILIVAHESKRITVVERDGGGWGTRDLRPGERVVLAAPSITFDSDAVYAAIEGL